MTTTAMVDVVGGPANGSTIERPSANTLNVPVLIPGHDGLGMFQYTLRRCQDARGHIVEVLAPAGRPIDPAWLAARKLTN